MYAQWPTGLRPRGGLRGRALHRPADHLHGAGPGALPRPGPAARHGLLPACGDGGAHGYVYTCMCVYVHGRCVCWSNACRSDNHITTKQPRPSRACASRSARRAGKRAAAPWLWRWRGTGAWASRGRRRRERREIDGWAKQEREEQRRMFGCLVGFTQGCLALSSLLIGCCCLTFRF